MARGWAVTGCRWASRWGDLHRVVEQAEPSWQGELVIRGAGLAQGYLGDEALTAARFADGVYRTGDLGRWQADGQLAFVGRRDDQLKLRGVRVSRLEVEAVLAGQPGVTAVR